MRLDWNHSLFPSLPASSCFRSAGRSCQERAISATRAASCSSTSGRDPYSERNSLDRSGKCRSKRCSSAVQSLLPGGRPACAAAVLNSWDSPGSRAADGPWVASRLADSTMERVSFEDALRLAAPVGFILTDGPAAAQRAGRCFSVPDGGARLGGDGPEQGVVG